MRMAIFKFLDDTALLTLLTALLQGISKIMEMPYQILYNDMMRIFWNEM